MNQDKITIVVPCYNEEEVLQIFMQEIMDTQEKLPEALLEVLFVNDGSTDNTLEGIKQLHAQYPTHVSYLSFSRNFGKEAAMIAGLEHARGDYIAVMDADLQDPPEMLIDMYQWIVDEGYDVVATARNTRAGEPPIRSFFARMFYKLNNKIADVHLEEGARDYRMMTRQVVNEVIRLTERNRFSKGLFSWVGFDVKYLEYKNVERVAGTTSWSFWGLFDYAIDGLVTFSGAPLSLASFVGFVTFLVSILMGFYIVVRTLIFGDPTPGWPSLAVLILGMSGLQLLGLGIIGKYIEKIFIETKQRPLYVLKEKELMKEAK